MKFFLSIIGLVLAASHLHAQWVVTNPISDALSEIQHFEDIAKAVEMINNQVEQINTLTQQLQQIQAYVKAFGDPEQLLSIVGADELISSLGQSGIGQTIGELQQLANGIEALQYDANGLYASLGETFTTPSGFQPPRAEKLYRKYGAIHQSSRNFQDVTDEFSLGEKLSEAKSLPPRSSFRRRRPTLRRRSSLASSLATRLNWEP